MTYAPVEIGDPAADRYATLRLIAGWRQDLVRSSRYLVVGAGALGNEVLKNLALLGVGRVAIVDFDEIEAANLTRSTLFRLEDAGRSKASTAAARVSAMNPDVHAVPIHADITTGVGAGVFRRVDLVFGCLDNRAARLAVSRACISMRRPWLDGALDVLMGSVRSMIPPDDACYECTMSAADYREVNVRYSCGAAAMAAHQAGRLPTTPTVASVVAALQVQEAMKLRHGDAMAPGRLVLFDGAALQMRTLTVTRRRDCPGHPRPVVVEPTTLGADSSVTELVAQATPHVGSGGWLLLDRDVVRALRCIRCRTRDVIFRPVGEVLPELAACGACHELRIPEVVTQVSGTGEAATVSLAQLGIPPLHVVRVRGQRETVALELSADLARVLPGWTLERES